MINRVLGCKYPLHEDFTLQLSSEKRNKEIYMPATCACLCICESCHQQTLTASHSKYSTYKCVSIFISQCLAVYFTQKIKCFLKTKVHITITKHCKVPLNTIINFFYVGHFGKKKNLILKGTQMITLNYFFFKIANMNSKFSIKSKYFSDA